MNIIDANTKNCRGLSGKGRIVSNRDHVNLRMSIESVADEVASELGSECVKEVFSMYGASSIENLSEGAYEQVFSELMRLSAD